MPETTSTETIKLERGSHPPDDGVCLLEAAARKAGEKHTDSPLCVSPVIAAYGRGLNDALDDEDRQLLVPFIDRLIGTRASIETEIRRAFLAVDWSIRRMV